MSGKRYELVPSAEPTLYAQDITVRMVPGPLPSGRPRIVCRGCGREDAVGNGPSFFPHPHPAWSYFGDDCHRLLLRWATMAAHVNREAGFNHLASAEGIIQFLFAELIHVW